MTRGLAFHCLSLFLVLAVLPSSGSAGPACAQKYWNAVDCISKCSGKWGYPGHTMGSDRWGSVMKQSSEIWAAVAANACGSESSSDTTGSGGKGVVGGVENGPPTSSSSSSDVAETSSSSSSKASSTSSSTSSSKTKSSTSTTATPTTTSQRQAAAKPTTTQQKQAPEPTTQEKPKETPQDKAPDNGDNGDNGGNGGNSNGNGGSSGSGGTSGGDIAAYLKGHNDARAQHGAAPLSWSDSLAGSAQKWANNCQFKHSGGSLGPFGENLAAGTGDSYGIASAIKSWTDESKDYNSGNPQASHFTQVVWKGSSQVGCALQMCDGIFDASFGKAKYYVCEYSKQGNVVGQFGSNVQA